MQFLKLSDVFRARPEMLRGLVQLWRANIVTAAVVAAAAVAMIIVNPFDGFTLFHHLTRNILSNILSVDYPKTNRPKIAVVLADDNYLSQWKRTWPLSLDDHSQIVEEIAKQNPRYIFIDFAFIDGRFTDAEVARFTEVLASAATHSKIFIGSTDDSASSGRILTQLRDLSYSTENIEIVSIAALRANSLNSIYHLPPDRRGGIPVAALAIAGSMQPVAVENLRRNEISEIDVQWPAPPPVSNCQQLASHRLEPACANISHSALVRGARLLASGVIKWKIDSATIQSLI
jgi:hypothetical protein